MSDETAAGIEPSSSENAQIEPAESTESASKSVLESLSENWDKFASDEGEDSPKQISDPSGDAGAETTQKAEPVAPAKPVAPSIKAPKSWSKEASEWLTAEPKTLEEAIELRRKIADYAAKRQTEVDSDYTSKTEQLAREREEFKKNHGRLDPFYRTLEPHLERFHLRGVDPQAWLNEVLAIDRLAAKDKRQAAAHILQSWGVDPRELAQSQNQPAIHPQVHQYLTAQERRVQELERRELAREQARQNALRGSVQSAISTFIGATDETGESKHPHYEQVESLMTPLVQQMRRAQPRRDPAEILEEAYEQATWAHPQVRAEILSRTQKTREEQERQEAAKRVAEAKRAAPPVSSGPNGKLVSPAMSTRDMLEHLWDEHA